MSLQVKLNMAPECFGLNPNCKFEILEKYPHTHTLHAGLGNFEHTHNLENRKNKNIVRPVAVSYQKKILVCAHQRVSQNYTITIIYYVHIVVRITFRESCY